MANASTEVGNQIRPRPRVHGKFLYIGSEKLYVRGVTYGTFRDSPTSGQFPAKDTVARDFAQMAANGINAVRTYTLPPLWLLELAMQHGLFVMAGIPWEQHITFLDDSARTDSIRKRLREDIQACVGHPAILCYSIGNEIPASIVRWHGRGAIENFLRSLYDCVKAVDPEGLTTYVNFPTTEFLQLDFLDFVSFNVYLEKRDRLEAYLARLHSLAGDRPLLMAEVGLDSRRNGEAAQAEVLEWQIQSVFSSGCAGVFLFAWTDEWHRGGHDIEDWDFGLVTRDRQPKAALTVVREAFLSGVPFPLDRDWPTVSVVICSYNGSRTIRETLEHVVAMPYPKFDVIVVNDGSSDATPKIAGEFAVRLISIPNGGLSNARNVGMRAAEGEIIAYCDDDAYPDRHWLFYLAHTYMTTSAAGAGGPNLPPPGDGPIAEAVANAPGGPNHVLLSDIEAEHIPGCNSSYRRSALLAVDGYDPAFRVAGDDVDLCWRIQENVGMVAFHPAALVWHHRRNSILAYYRQQRGYGKAEALLERKWPEKYNISGHLSWHGRIYATGILRAITSRSRIYHGVWGTGAFQSLYDEAPQGLEVLAQMPEWYLLCGFLAILSLLGILWPAFLIAVPLLVIACFIVLVQIALSSSKAVFPSRPRTFLTRLKLITLTAFLFLIQPVARLSGRIRWGLSPWRVSSGHGWLSPLPRKLIVWTESWRSDESWLHELEGLLKKERAWVARGGNFDDWDLQSNGGISGGVRLTMAIEEHGGGKQLVRFRLQPRLAPVALSAVVIFAALALFASRSGAIGLGIAAAVVMLVTICHSGFATATVVAAVDKLRSNPGAGPAS